jgi:mannose/fructose/N-acetylgalactosamine-specific phosphotransferase system component IID
MTRMPAFGRVLARLFFLQASWNYERMQGVGFGHAMEPALHHLAGDEAGLRSALSRYTRFFNSHPYFAGLAVGAALRAELEGESPERIERLRAALCSPLGSLGDRLIWAGWLPTCAALALSAVAFGARVWAVLGFLVLYNLVHVACRVWALRAGWRQGMSVASALASPLLRAGSRVAGPVAALMVGAAVPLALAWQMRGADGGALAVAAAGALVFAGAVRLARGRADTVVIAAVVLGATWIAGLLWR